MAALAIRVRKRSSAPDGASANSIFWFTAHPWGSAYCFNSVTPLLSPHPGLNLSVCRSVEVERINLRYNPKTCYTFSLSAALIWLIS